jgi:phospholipase C
VSHSNNPANDGLLGNVGPGGHAQAGSYQDRLWSSHIKIDAAMVHGSFINHSIIDQSSVLCFIEDNWSLGRIGDQSFDSKAGSFANYVRSSPNS